VSTIYVLVVLYTGLMATKVLSLPQIFIPTPQGGRKPVQAPSGSSILSILRKHQVAVLAAKRGVERRDPSTGKWSRISMSQVLREGDVVRVRFAPPGQSNSQLGGVLKALFSSAQRRKSGSSRNRRRRK
jgi:hypothetical protein